MGTDIIAQETRIAEDTEAFAQALGAAFADELPFIQLKDKDGTAWSKAGRGIMSKMGLQIVGWQCPKDLSVRINPALTAGFTPCDECVAIFARTRV